MAWTKYGWYIEIDGDSFLATYNSDIDANWKSGGVLIKDRGNFSGYVSFGFRTNVQRRVTYGFYLNVKPGESKQQYAFAQDVLPASEFWGLAWNYVPPFVDEKQSPSPFDSYGIGDGRTIDTLKEIWIGQVNLGKRYSPADLSIPDQRFIAAEYGIYTDDANGRWVCVRDGSWMLYSDGLEAFSWYINEHANWWLNQDISVWEWDNTQNYGDIAHGLREAIARRNGFLWLGDRWWDTKSALGDYTLTDFTSSTVVAWMNARKLKLDMRIASDGDAGVYTVVVPRPTLDWLEISSEVYA